MKWLDSGAPVLALLIVLSVCIIAHNAALGHLEMMGTPLTGMKPTVAARLQFITYMDAHPLIILPYLAAFIAALVRLQIRESPHWCLFFTFALLVLPLYGYVWICLRVTTTASLV